MKDAELKDKTQKTGRCKRQVDCVVMAELIDGKIVKLEKDCGCITHNGPHWLHMDDIDKSLNKELLRPDGLSLYAFQQAELRRLAKKRKNMERDKIKRIIREP